MIIILQDWQSQLHGHDLHWLQLAMKPLCAWTEVLLSFCRLQHGLEQYLRMPTTGAKLGLTYDLFHRGWSRAIFTTLPRAQQV